MAPRRTVLFRCGFSWPDQASWRSSASLCQSQAEFPPKSKIVGEAMKREREAFDCPVQVRMSRSMAEELNEAAASDLRSRSALIRIKMADYLKSRSTEIAGAA